MNFEIGDRVICNGQMDDIFFEEQEGTIIGFYGELNLVKFDYRFNDNLHDGDNIEDPTCSSYYISSRLLTIADPVKKEELRKKREELRKKYMDVDPYGEENWELESRMITKFSTYVNESESVRIGEYKKTFSIFDIYEKTKNLIDFENRLKDELINFFVEFLSSTKDQIIKSKITDVQVVKEGFNRSRVFLFDEEGNKHHVAALTVITVYKDYDSFIKMKEKEEKLRLKHLEIDPYGEEDWGI